VPRYSGRIIKDVKIGESPLWLKWKLKLLGEVVFSFEFDLSKDRKLVKAEAQEVIRLMKESGYFLQMPPAKNEILGLKAN